MPALEFVSGSMLAVAERGVPSRQPYQDCAVRYNKPDDGKQLLLRPTAQPFPLQLKCGVVNLCGLSTKEPNLFVSSVAEQADLSSCLSGIQQGSLFLPPPELEIGAGASSPSGTPTSFQRFSIPDSQRCGVSTVMQRFCFDVGYAGFSSSVPVCATRQGARWGHVAATAQQPPAPTVGEELQGDVHSHPHVSTHTLPTAEAPSLDLLIDGGNSLPTPTALVTVAGDSEAGGEDVAAIGGNLQAAPTELALRSHVFRVVGATFIDSKYPHSLRRVVRYRGKFQKGVLAPVTDEIRDVRRYVLTSRTSPPPMEGDVDATVSPPQPLNDRDRQRPSTSFAPLGTNVVHLVYLHRKTYEFNLGHTLMRVLGLHSHAAKLQYEHREAFRKWAFPSEAGDNRTAAVGGGGSALHPVAPGTLSPDGRFAYEPLVIKIVIGLKEGASDLKSFFLPLLAAGMSSAWGASEVIVAPDDGSRLHPDDPSVALSGEDFLDPTLLPTDSRTCPFVSKPHSDAGGGARGQASSSPSLKRVVVWPYVLPPDEVAASTLNNSNNKPLTAAPTAVANNVSLSTHSRLYSEGAMPPPRAPPTPTRPGARGSRAEVLCFDNAVLGYIPLYFGDGYHHAYVGDASPDYVSDFYSRKRRSGSSSGGVNIKWKRKGKNRNKQRGGGALPPSTMGDGEAAVTDSALEEGSTPPPDGASRLVVPPHLRGDSPLVPDQQNSRRRLLAAAGEDEPLQLEESTPKDNAKVDSDESPTAASSPPSPEVQQHQRYPPGGSHGGNADKYNLNPRFLVDGVRAFRAAMVDNWKLRARCHRRMQRGLPQARTLTLGEAATSPLPRSTAARTFKARGETEEDVDPRAVVVRNIRPLVPKPPISTAAVAGHISKKGNDEEMLIEDGGEGGGTPAKHLLPLTSTGGNSVPHSNEEPRAGSTPSPTPVSYVAAPTTTTTTLAPMRDADYVGSLTVLLPRGATPASKVRGSYSHEDRVLRVLIVNRRHSRRINNIEDVRQAVLGVFGNGDRHSTKEEEVQAPAAAWGPLRTIPDVSGGTSPFIDAKVTEGFAPSHSSSLSGSGQPAPIPEELYERDRNALMAEMGVAAHAAGDAGGAWGAVVETAYMEDFELLASSTEGPSASKRGPLSLSEQAAVHHCADVVVMVHGAALGWAASMMDGATLIEILPPFWGGGIVRLGAPNQGAITYSNGVHHHVVSCGGRYTMAQVSAGAPGGFMGVMDAKFAVPNAEVRQIQWLVVTGLRRRIAQAGLMV